MFRFPLLMISILAVMVLSAGLVGPYFVEWTTYRAQIEAQLTQLAGRKVVIGNSIIVRLLPAPELRLENIEIEDPANTSAVPLLKARKLHARLELTPLLRGTFRFTSLEMIDPEFNIAIKGDGTNNLALLKGKKYFGNYNNIRLDQVVVRNGVIRFHDQRNDSQYEMLAVNADLSARALTGPLRLTGDFIANGVRRHLKLATGKFRNDGQGKTGVTLRAVLKTDEAAGAADTLLTYVFDGRVRDVTNHPNFDGKFQIAGSSEALQANAADGDTPQLSLEAHVKGDFSTAGFDKIAIVLGRGKRTTALSGQARIDWARAPFRIDAALKANRIDLASLQPAGQGAGQLKTLISRLAARVSAMNFVGKTSLDAGMISLGGGQIEGVGLTLQFAKGRIYVQRAVASFPGNSQLTMTGTYRPHNTKQKFSGSIAFQALDVRAFAQWALPGPGGDLAFRLPRMFSNVSLKGGFEAGDDQFRFKEAAFKSGAVSGKMGLTYAFGARPRFGARFVLDEIDVDQMIRVQALSSPAKKPSKDTNRAFAKNLSHVLQAFDANIILQLDRAIYRGVPVKKAEVDLKLLRGELVIKHMGFSDIAGVRMSAHGKLTQLGFQPRGSLVADIVADRPEGLSALFDYHQVHLRGSPGLAQWMARQGPARLGLDLKVMPGDGVNGIELVSKLKGVLATSQIAMEARFNGSPGAPEKGAIDLQIEISNKASDRLLAQLGLQATPGPKRQSGLVRAAVTGKLDGTLDLAMGWQAYGVQGTASGSGKLTPQGPTIEAQLKIDGKDITPLLAGLGIGTVTTGRILRPVHMKGLIAGKGGEFVLTGFKGVLGSNKFKLNGTADFTGPRPQARVVAKLDYLSLPWILSYVMATGTAVHAGAETAPASWSSTPFNLGVFSAIDTNVTAQINQVKLRGKTQLETVSTRFALVDGTLELHKFAGKILGGQLALDGSIGTRAGKLSLGLKYHLQDGRLERLMIDGQGDVLASGQLAIQGTLKGQGLSVVGLVSSLDGAGKISVRDGTLRGINPETFARALQNVNNETELDGYINGILVDGQMAFSAIDSDFTIRSGLVRMAEMSLKGRGATARLISFIDLAAYKLDSEWQFKLTAYPQAPAVTLLFSGPLDNPERAFDVKGLRQHLVMEKLKRKLDKLEELQKEQERLERERLKRARLERARVKRVKLEQAKLKRARLERAREEQVKLKRARLERAREEQARLERKTHTSSIKVKPLPPIVPNAQGKDAITMPRMPDLPPVEIIGPKPDPAPGDNRPVHSFVPDQPRGPKPGQGPIILFGGQGNN